MCETARLLFAENGLEFRPADITRTDALTALGPFDCLVMIDVYEHIAAAERTALHQRLSELLTPNGRLILSFPSEFLQRRLMDEQPEELQPIDEIVTFADIERLARDLRAQVAHLAYVDIHAPRDYAHACLARAQSGASAGPIAPRPVVPDGREARGRRVVERLHKRVASHEIMLPAEPGPPVCVIAENVWAYSATFLRDHVERLPTTVRYLGGNLLQKNFPAVTDEGRALAPPWRQALDWAAMRWRGQPRIRFSRRSLIHFLHANRIAVVLAEFGPTGVAVMEACARASLPLVVHFHSYDAYARGILKWHGADYRELWRKAQGLVVVSQHMANQLASLGAPQEKIACIPCGVDVSAFTPGDPAAAPLFLTVGRFVEKKGPHLAIAAFKQVHDACPEARLVMVGDGPLLEAARHLVRGWRLTDAVDLRRPLAPGSIAELMRSARALVQHSLTNSDGEAEGMPMCVIEAGAAGLPVIGTRHGGIPDVVFDGETGLLVDEYDVDATAAAMLRLIREPQFAAALGHAARERVVANFSLDQSIPKLWQVLQTAIRDFRPS